MQNKIFLVVTLDNFKAKLKNKYRYDKSTLERHAMETFLSHFGCNSAIKAQKRALKTSLCIDLIIPSQPNLVVERRPHSFLHADINYISKLAKVGF